MPDCRVKPGNDARGVGSARTESGLTPSEANSQGKVTGTGRSPTPRQAKTAAISLQRTMPLLPSIKPLAGPDLRALIALSVWHEMPAFCGGNRSRQFMQI
jgi:hypothetical protein